MATKYVDHDAGDDAANTGDSFASAYATIQKALDVRTASELSLIYVQGNATGLSSLDPTTGIGTPNASFSPLKLVGVGMPELNFGTNDFWSTTSVDGYGLSGFKLITEKNDGTVFLRGDDFIDVSGNFIQGVSGNDVGGILLHEFSRIRGNIIKDVSSPTRYGAYAYRYGAIEQNIILNHSGLIGIGSHRATCTFENYVESTTTAYAVINHYSTFLRNVAVNPSGSNTGTGFNVTNNQYGIVFSQNYSQGFSVGFDLGSASYNTFLGNWSYDNTTDYSDEDSNYPVEQNVAVRSLLNGYRIDDRLLESTNPLYQTEIRKYETDRMARVI